MNPVNQPRQRPKGQILILFVLMAMVIFLFAGMGIDFGLVYLSKARLSRSVDSLGLRLANNLPTNTVERARTGLDVMRANYPNFLSQVVYTNGDFIPAGSVSSTTNAVGAVTTLITNSGQSLTFVTRAIMNTNVNPPLKITMVEAKARTTHPTYFLRLVGKETIPLEEIASAERAPNVIILILDVSGSMKYNNGWSILPRAVTNFVAMFNNSQDQDFMAVVTFSSYATLVWPTNHLASPTNVMVPSNNFVAPVTAFMTNVENATTRALTNNNEFTAPGIRFSGVTCAQEGLRLGYEVADNLLGGITDPVLKAKLKTYYVFFTDGDFNTTRTFVRGNGFGLEPHTSGTQVPGTSFQLKFHSTNTLPFFHHTLPLACYRNDFSAYTNVLVANNTSASFSTTSFNLNSSTRFGNYVTNVVGTNIVVSNSTVLTNFRSAINCTMAGFASRNSGWHHLALGNEGGVRWPGFTEGSGSQYAGVPFERDETDGRWQPSGDNRHAHASLNNAVTNATNDFRIWTNMNHILWTTNNYWTNWNRLFVTNSTNVNGAITNLNQTNSYWMAAVEIYKQAYDYSFILPTPIHWDSQNPLKATNYPTNIDAYTQRVKNSTRFLSHYPSGRAFANIYGSHYQRSGSTNTRHPYQLPDNTNGWEMGTVRLSDFYPDYTFGPRPTNALTFTNSMGASATNVSPRDLALYTRPLSNNTTGVFYQYYSFRNGQWTNFNFTNSTGNTDVFRSQHTSANENTITSEGNWLTMMQAWIARKEHNARIYFVNFQTSVGSPVEKRNIANDRTGLNGVGASPFFPDQPTGAFYATTNEATMNAAFEDIGRKITTRLTE
jgi:Flp pilus assembly protein TadG